MADDLVKRAREADDCYQVMDGVDPRDVLALHAEIERLKKVLAQTLKQRDAFVQAVDRGQLVYLDDMREWFKAQNRNGWKLVLDEIDAYDLREEQAEMTDLKDKILDNLVAEHVDVDSLNDVIKAVLDDMREFEKNL